MKQRIDFVLEERFNAFLLHYVESPVAFRSVLRLARSIISGSAALHFILDSPETWQAGDCDVYVPIGFSLPIVRHLQEVEGYRSVHPLHHDMYIPNEIGPSGESLPYISSVCRLKRSDGVCIDVIESNSATALHPLAAFWSTHLYNYLSADSICVAYPAMTWDCSGCVRADADAKARRAVAKYEARGFRLSSFQFNINSHLRSTYPSILDGCGDYPYCPHTFRSFGDEWCMQTVFNEDMAAGHAVDKETPWWRFGGRLCGGCSSVSSRSVGLLGQ